MKTRIMLIGVILLVVMGLSFAGEIPYSIIKKNIDNAKLPHNISNLNSKDIHIPNPPVYNFGIDPIDLGGTVYDYMPGSYCSFPIRVQPEQTESGNLAGGVYIVFHNQVTGNGKRRVNYAYVNPMGIVSGSGTVSNVDIREGFAGMFIDPVSADPLVSYHLDVDGDNVLDDNFSYDNYDFVGLAGLWLNPPFTVINNSQFQNQGIIQQGDQFIWPYVEVGGSPIEGKRRVYISTNNSNNSTGSTAYPSENVLLAYADFDSQDLINQSPSTWDWHYRTIQQMDDWHNENPEWARPFDAFVVKDNYVVYIGELIYNSEVSSTTPKLFALVNDNYGEGDFTYYEFDYQNEWPISDVQTENGNSWLYGDTQEAQLRWTMFLSEHLNAIFLGENTVSFPGALAIEYFDNQQNKWYIAPGLGHTYVKEFTFNIQTGEFGIQDVYPPDLSQETNNTPVVPWDLNGDGQVDRYDQDGYPTSIPLLPVFYTDLEHGFEYNLIHITKSDDDSLEAIVWNDCYEAYLNENGIAGYEDWAETSKIMIATKVDGRWRTPITIDAKTDDDNYNEAINGMIPCYVYPADNIMDMEDHFARLNLFFLNDDSYGSSIIGNGATPNPDNCRLEYAAIDFSKLSTKENRIVPMNDISAMNYPNPFNPETTINYQLKENGSVELNVYNIKGQLVKTLVKKYQKTGEHNVVWNGTDNSGNRLASGIYFYKIKQGKFTSTRKMILMK